MVYAQIVGSCLPALQTAQFDGNAAGEGGAVFIGGYGRTTACRRGDSCQCSSAVLGPDTLAAFVDVRRSFCSETHSACMKQFPFLLAPILVPMPKCAPDPLAAFSPLTEQLPFVA